MMKTQEPTKQAGLPAKAAASLPGDDKTFEFAAHEGGGMAGVTARDLLVPRLSILQSLSPQLKRSRPEYVEGAQEGMICDVGTGDLFVEGVSFLPVLYRKEWLEWAPRDSGKGLVGFHTNISVLDRCTPNHKGQPVLENGNRIIETAQFFGLNLTAGNRRCFVAMASTQLKRARRWITLATGERLLRPDGTTYMPPLWYRTYLLSSAEESNAGGAWHGWRINRDLPLPQLAAPLNWRELKADAIDFANELAKDDVRGDLSAEPLAEDASHAYRNDEGAM